MIERKFLGVQHRTTGLEPGTNSTVRCITDYRVADGGEVDSNLVRATRFQSALDQGRVLGLMERAFDRVMGS